MIQRMKFLAVAAIAAVLVACGGGGDDTPSFAGRYFESLTITASTCGTVGTKFEAADTVNQDGRSISINSEGLIMTGSIDGDNGGFSASGSGVVNGNSAQGTMKYRTVTEGSKYDVEFVLSASGCTITGKGTATKI